MSTKMFHSIRYFTQIVLPALATFLITVGGAWGFEIGVQVGTTIAAVITLFSGIMGASSAIYDKERGYNDDRDIDSDDACDFSDLHRYVHVSCMARTERSEEEE